MILDPDQHSYLGTTPTGEHFAIAAATRMRHLHLVGQTGTGKSSALLLLISQHLAAGAGVALLDPHGDLAEHVLSFVPKSRAHGPGFSQRCRWVRTECQHLFGTRELIPKTPEFIAVRLNQQMQTTAVSELERLVPRTRSVDCKRCERHGWVPFLAKNSGTQIYTRKRGRSNVALSSGMSSFPALTL
jgi:hypothetical protein